VTAFYGIYDPIKRTLSYSRAGHCPPRVRRANGQIVPLDQVPSLPLGIQASEPYCDITEKLEPGDVVVFYTDGIIESRDPSGDLFGTERLDKILGRCAADAEAIIRNTLLAIEEFTDDQPPTDDLTLLIAKVS
jgi:sigma-B regulation protein RsbU (phosphoserine phosphatase)